MAILFIIRHAKHLLVIMRQFYTKNGVGIAMNMNGECIMKDSISSGYMSNKEDIITEFSKYSNKVPCLFLLSLLFYIPILADGHYQREMIFETAAKVQPLNLPLFCLNGAPFEWPSNRIQGHDISYSFAFDNDGNLILADHSNREISIYNFQNKNLIKFDPIYNEFNIFSIIRVGPQNEIYVELKAEKDNGKHKFFELVKFLRTGNDYVKDDKFSTGEFDYPFINLSISPDGYLYSMKQSFFGDASRNQINMFNSAGQLIKVGNPSGRTSNGTEFYFETEKTEAGKKRLRIINANSSAIMAQSECGRWSDFRLLCSTFDNKIIFRDWHSERVALDNDFYLITTRPYFIVVDLGSGLTTEIPTSECARDDYLYFNVSRVGCNYKGELFAAVVYFNTPGEITGDEKIVFYRWRLE